MYVSKFLHASSFKVRFLWSILGWILFLKPDHWYGNGILLIKLISLWINLENFIPLFVLYMSTVLNMVWQKNKIKESCSVNLLKNLTDLEFLRKCKISLARHWKMSLANKIWVYHEQYFCLKIQAAIVKQGQNQW
jgi:hypothetical protein